jgi:D-alanyl-D-alanine carboxypeptidase
MERRGWIALGASLVVLTACVTGAAAGGLPEVKVSAITKAPTATAPPPSPDASPARRPPKIHAASAILQDLDTGQVLYQLKPDRRIPIASLTKIMTAMVVRGRTEPDDLVTASRWAARQEPTKLGLRTGWRMRVNALMWALMLHSANDVAVALAEHVAGSTAAFDSLMTLQARSLGMMDTRFASPSGLADRGYSTAQDVAVMTRWAMASPAFAALVGTRYHTIGLPDGERIRLKNINDLLFEYPGATGVKTGYTEAAGKSLVGTAERDGVRLLVVVLGEEDHPFPDGEKLLDYGFRVLASGS